MQYHVVSAPAPFRHCMPIVVQQNRKNRFMNKSHSSSSPPTHNQRKGLGPRLVACQCISNIIPLHLRIKRSQSKKEKVETQQRKEMK